MYYINQTDELWTTAFGDADGVARLPSQDMRNEIFSWTGTRLCVWTMWYALCKVPRDRVQKQRSISHKILRGRLRKLTNWILCLVIIMHRCAHSIFYLCHPYFQSYVLILIFSVFVLFKRALKNFISMTWSLLFSLFVVV